ncbi:DUF4349 domain-containing protein [archaeon]|nr:DUF4349 domain-containing protein [archaeon]
MGLKKQFATIKENWLMIVLGLVLIVFLSNGSGIVSQSFDSVMTAGDSFDKGYGGGVASESMNYRSGGSDDFAPETEERKITKSSSLSTEIERGGFSEAEGQLKNIVRSSGAYLLNERVNRNGESWRAYYSGYYSLKIDTSKYDAVVAQLKEIGEVQSFSENMVDVTGRYEDIEIEIGVEKARLLRYLEMYDEADEVSDKINLNDRIFNQERKIKYLEDSLRNIDNRVDYSSVSFSMSEERSEWIGIVFVKLSDLVRSFVSSINTLLSFIFGFAPWAIAFFIGRWIWKKFKK